MRTDPDTAGTDPFGSNTFQFGKCATKENSIDPSAGLDFMRLGDYACNCRDRMGPERLVEPLNEANTKEIGMVAMPNHIAWEDCYCTRDMKLWIFFRKFE
jgi:hypothetical protein